MSNAYTYSVPFTAEQLHHDYVVCGMSQKEVGAKWCVSQKVVWRALLKSGIASRKAAPRNQRLERNNNWRGGRVLVAKRAAHAPYANGGYYYIKREGHPNALKNGYVAEHIAVALDCANLESLPAGHCVHHINCQKQDNRPANLAICSHKDHQRYHTQLEELAVRLLLETGRIKFIEGEGYVEAAL